MGSLLLESAADREVNSSWPRAGRGRGWRLMHALAYIWGLTAYPALSVIHSPSLRTIYHYSSAPFVVVQLVLLHNLLASDTDDSLSAF